VDSVVSVKGAIFSYHGQKVVEGIDFELKKGDFAALLGHNGAGKSTLMKLILGLLAPERGEILLFGKNPLEFCGLEKIGYMQQSKEDLDFEFPASVLEIVLMGTLKSKKGMFKSYSKKDYAQARGALELVGAWKLRDNKVGALSGGQRQRVFLAQAMAGSSELLVLDEPTSSMDFASQQAFYDTLVELNKKHGITILLITHDVGQVLQHAKRVLVLNRKIVFDGEPKALSKGEILEIMERV